MQPVKQYIIELERYIYWFSFFFCTKILKQFHYTNILATFIALDLESLSEFSHSSSDSMSSSDDDHRALDDGNDAFWSYYSSVFVKNNLTLICSEDIARLVNKVPGSNSKIPGKNGDSTKVASKS